jgi:serine/threonine protein phosphatase PrpC
MNAIKDKLIPDELDILQRRFDKLSLLILTSNGLTPSAYFTDEEIKSIKDDIVLNKEELIELINKSINRINKLLFLLRNREENYV